MFFKLCNELGPTAAAALARWSHRKIAAEGCEEGTCGCDADKSEQVLVINKTVMMAHNTER